MYTFLFLYGLSFFVCFFFFYKNVNTAGPQGKDQSNFVLCSYTGYRFELLLGLVRLWRLSVHEEGEQLNVSHERSKTRFQIYTTPAVLTGRSQ